jgi:uncharacterized protein YjiS (DUF1127 family)
MTKKLEELFNLDSVQEVTPEESVEEVTHADPEVTKAAHEEVRNLDDQARAIAQITRDLPAINELEQLDDKELDDLAAKAEQAYDDLMDLGMNVEVRYSGRIFEVASSMIRNAIDAKTSKMDKKLKAIDLQLRKYKIDQGNRPTDDDDDIVNGEGYVISDRNELLKKLGKKD